MADFIEVPPWAMPASPEAAPAAVPSPRASMDPATAAPIATVGWVISNGSARTAVTGPGLVGRNPTAAQGEVIDHLISVGETARSVSKTHLGFGVDPDGFWVVDRNSTNGSAVLAPDGTVTRCEPGVRVPVASGSRVRVGDVELTVTLA